jgi:hypothetical protein
MHDDDIECIITHDLAHVSSQQYIIFIYYATKFIFFDIFMHIHIIHNKKREEKMAWLSPKEYAEKYRINLRSLYHALATENVPRSKKVMGKTWRIYDSESFQTSQTIYPSDCDQVASNRLP